MLAHQVATIATPYMEHKNQVLASTSNMHSGNTIINNSHNEYHMHLTTTEARASRRVQKNFNSMRMGYKFR